jgi:hypothetical protein
MVRKDDPPNGEAANIDRIIEQLRFWSYPVTLRRSTPLISDQRNVDITLGGSTPSVSSQRIFTPMQVNTDLFGADYEGFDSSSPDQCETACKKETRCRAWTYVKAGLKGPQARCYLKDHIPPRRSDTCCISGSVSADGNSTMSSGGATVPVARDSVPQFGGVWEIVEHSFNGVPQNRGGRITFVQDGTVVRDDRRTYTISATGTLGFQMFLAHDSEHGHEVSTAAEADLIQTYTWRVDGQFLMQEAIYYYKNQYFGHPQGKDVRIVKLRRVSP